MLHRENVMADFFKNLIEQVLIWECQGEIPRHKFYPADETILRRLRHGS